MTLSVCYSDVMAKTNGTQTTETRITIRVPSSVAYDMKVLAHADDRSVNAEIVRALREFIERHQQAGASRAS